jgi:hypothetical protein
MSTIKVNTIDNAGSNVDFPHKLKVRGSAIEQGYTASGTEPSSPSAGDYWFDSTNEKTFQYIDSQFKEISIKPPQIAWGGTRGFRLGGNGSNIIDYFDIQTSGNAVDFGDIAGSTTARQGGSVGNQSRVVTGLGFSNFSGSYTQEDRMEYITCSTTGNAVNFGNLTVGRYENFAVSNGTRGVFMGGKGSGDATNIMDYITIATTGDATDFGNLNSYNLGGSNYDQRSAHAAISGSTRGVIGGGGNNYRGGGDEIQYITIATAGNATNFGDLTANRANFSGCSDLTRGLFMGGAAETGGQENINNNIQYITLDTAGNAADFGDLTYTSQGSASCADNTYGCQYGGYGAGYAQVNTIDRVTIATLGNSADHGDLTDNKGLYTQGASGNAA